MAEARSPEQEWKAMVRELVGVSLCVLVMNNQDITVWDILEILAKGVPLARVRSNAENLGNFTGGLLEYRIRGIAKRKGLLFALRAVRSERSRARDMVLATPEGPKKVFLHRQMDVLNRFEDKYSKPPFPPPKPGNPAGKKRKS